MARRPPSKAATPPKRSKAPGGTAGSSTPGRSPAAKRTLLAKLFSPEWYAKRRFGDPEVTGEPLPFLDADQLLTDYMKQGAKLDVSPHPLFDPVWYRSQLDKVPRGELLLEHYLTRGRHLSPHPSFSPDSPAAKAAPPERHPLLFYLRTPRTWHLAPNPLFDGAHYLGTYTDVASAGLHPLVHYLEWGQLEYRTTTSLFDLDLYRELAGEPSRDGALVDFLRQHRPVRSHQEDDLSLRAVVDPAGVRTGLEAAQWAYTTPAILRRAELYTLVSPFFDASWYARARFGGDADPADFFDPDTGTLLDDYLLRGAAYGIGPHLLFDPAWYESQFSVLPAGVLSVEHYLTQGGAFSPHPTFDPTSPAAKAAPAGQNPLVYYLNRPETWHLAPNDYFDGAFYLDLYSDVVLAQANPLVHYLTYGEAEERVASQRFDVDLYRGICSVPAGASPLTHFLRQRRITAAPTVDGLSFPVHEAPAVSIVIPVYGHWAHTQACLEALAASDSDPTFEVIVVDDAGPDNTASLLSQVPGLRLIRHEVNTGFVDACNTGIEAARGEFVALLNNDTRVSPDWLAPLIETLLDDGVGLVGAKLVYPDGHLQEAGGIIFSDASGWNYGKFLAPDASEFNYRRRVDYCSGAAVVARKSTLDQLGGLDREFAPAYYEDTDLAFAVRELGLDVVYEPRSVVIHDEGVSHGTDETHGVKAYQTTNKAKFQVKWAKALARQLPPGADMVPLAARVHQGRDLVVVIDHYVPRPDQDSGSLRMFSLIAELVRQGHGVIFVPANGFKSGRYGKILQTMGVEVAHGPHDWTEFFGDLVDSVRAVIVSRVYTAMAFAPMLREALPDVPIIFDTVDLHFLRLEREASLVGSSAATATATLTREFELALIRSVDTTLVVSTAEKELLADLTPDADIRIVSNVHRRLDADAFPPPNRRQGVVFVGSFAHLPNRDGIEWFLDEVLPLIQAHLPNIPVRIVGADPPQDLVQGAPSGVEYLGWVEDLAGVYGVSRVAIAPLRYGAGVKGKVGEAMAYGLPVVTTTVGAEGLGLEHRATALIADTPEDFAAAIVAAVRDDQLWGRLSAAAREHVDQVLGQERFSASVRDLFAD
ncbi:MAG: glycosyltransferase [Bifidobacteriaceae bacterium]|jgi:GT2 family glycosyltransferase/glycosyltransferase involved in cell wall biosynthesis|nr:glycosyltransferase [Bifidobacteriaceae bacterium]